MFRHKEQINVEVGAYKVSLTKDNIVIKFNDYSMDISSKHKMYNIIGDLIADMVKVYPSQRQDDSHYQALNLLLSHLDMGMYMLGSQYYKDYMSAMNDFASKIQEQ